MNTKFTRIISMFLACIILLSVYTGTITFANAEDEPVAVIEVEPKNGWNEDKTQYFVNDEAVKGFYTVEGKKYYFDENTAIKVTGLKAVNGNYYLFATTGEMLYGLQIYENERYYFDRTTGIGKKGLVNVDGSYYLFADNAKIKTGFQNYNGSRYYFNPPAGKMCIGLKKIDNAYYLFAENGKMLTCWRSANNASYYFDKDTGKAYTGFKKIGGAYYYFASNGKRVTGWKTIGGAKYYFDKKSAKAATGLKKIGSSYYFFANNGKCSKGWKNIGKYRYFFNTSTFKGTKGLKKIGGAYYYFNASCKMQTGWKTVSGYRYYFNPTKGKNYGKAVKGTVTIKGQRYVFNKNGACVSEKTIMLKKANGYSSKTNYLVLVNKNTHKVGIFTGKKGNWKMVKYFSCTIGAAATPTPTGKFTLGPSRGMPYHQIYFDSGAVRCWYASRIIGGYNFHSVLYTQASKPVAISDPRLGMNLSHGCVRLHINNAKWFYNHVPSGTTCIIYKK